MRTIKISKSEGHSGAGVMMFENDKNGTNLILVNDISKNSYTEPGGGYDNIKHESIAETAIEELYEETSALFHAKNVSSIVGNKNYIDKKYRKKKYRTYFILLKNRLTNQYRKDYHHNTYELQTNIYLFDGDSSYRETNDITKVSLLEIFSVLNLNNKIKNVWVKDIYNKKIKLHKRTARILRMLSENIYDKDFDIKTIHYKRWRNPSTNLIEYRF